MSKKAKIIVIVACVAGALLTALVAAFVVREWLFSREYVPGDDEIAMFFVLDMQEDIGLIVFDYTVDGQEHGGGVSNADRSMIKKDDVIVDVWNKEHLKCDPSAAAVDLTVSLRIITEYVDPNFENIYPEELTKRLEPVSWRAEFGRSYNVYISGSKAEGYKVSVETRETGK
ncbi:MAG: hypothetical protein J5912_03565 [Clostridia bacterium]|nr:hypothetical protein [Clostridia bacterium]